MFDFIGMLIGLVFLCALAVVLGLVIAVLAWLLFWGRRRPKKLILLASVVPLFSIAYWTFSAILFALVVPNQPDLIFGDFAEPLPNGYVLKGLAKMPEYAFLDTNNGRNQPGVSAIKSLEQNGDMLFGAYSHPDYGSEEFFAPKGVNYFKFDTRSGKVDNYGTLQELNLAAGHTVHLVESQFFRSQLPQRIRLRRIENGILFVPPIAILLLLMMKLVRLRFLAGRTLLD